jgi:ferredoxin
MRLVIDAELCTGHGRCYALAPDVVDADDRGLGVVVVTGELEGDLLAQAERAVLNCPERAISFEG